MMFNRGYFSNSGCFGFGYFGAWHYLIILGCIGLIVALFLWVRNRNRSLKGNEAIQALKVKYIQGEITEEEYLSRKNILSRK